MKTAVTDLINGYKSYVGFSKIIPLFLIAMIAVYFINIYDCESKRRRINPAVFLLSVWSGIAYAITLFIKKAEKKSIIAALFSLVMIVYSGSFIFSKEAYPYSIYYYTPWKITVISIISIVAFFIIYFMISCQLFDEYKDRIVFMGFVLIMHLFSFYSEKTVSMSVFLYPISVQSVIIHDIMPFILWAGLLYDKTKPKEQNVVDVADVADINDDDYQEEWDMKKHKILNMRNMAIAFGALVVVLLVCVYFLNSKINNLYNATVALEEATKGKVSMYEFIPDGKSESEATLVISGDGRVTVSGGGAIENGQALYEFISEHTQYVDKWYLYGGGDDNKGAFDYCLNSGITVGNCYYMNLEELVFD